jgi:drug/metabolite transporter (DMT)-like permease
LQGSVRDQADFPQAAFAGTFAPQVSGRIVERNRALSGRLHGTRTSAMQGTINQTMGASAWGMLIVLGFLWGGTLFLTELALPGFTPVPLAFFRVLIAGCVLAVLAYVMGMRFSAAWSYWGPFLLLGFLNNALPFSLIMSGQTQITGSLASILNATTPLSTVLVAHFLTRDEKLNGTKLAGIALGLAGVAVMTGLDALRGLGLNVLAQLAVVLAGVAYAFAAVYGRRFQDKPPLEVAASQLLASAVILTPWLLLVEPIWLMAAPGWGPVTALLAMALLSTSLAYFLYFRILQTSGATNVLLVTFLNPVSAIALGAVFLSERLEPQHMAGLALIGLGLAAIDGRPLGWLRRTRK